MQSGILRFFGSTLWCLSALSLSELGAAPSNINKSAQALAKHLAPSPPSKSARPGDLAKPRGQMIKAIEVLEQSYRSNGPQPESLMTTAFRFRGDMADFEQLMVTSAVINAWREANARGLFDESGHYQERITKGRGEGGRCVFELIVPAETYPPACNQLANVRLVPADRARKPEAELTGRETAHHEQLVKMIEEKASRIRMAAIEKGAPPKKRPETNSLGQDKKTSEALWEKEAEAAGDAVRQLPVVRLQGKLTGTPSHNTQQRWRVTTQVTNLSKHPTEVEVDVYLIGVTYEKRDHYLMSKTTRKLQLRQNENLSFDSFTKAENSYKGKADDHDEIPKKERKKTKVRCRGFVTVVRHGDKTVSFTGSDKMLVGYGDPQNPDSPLHSLPQF